MNEELQKALADVINKAASGIDTASDFIMAELPEVVQQAMTWYMVESLIYFVIGVIMIASSLKVIKYQRSFFYDSEGNLNSWCEDVFTTSAAYDLSIIGIAILDIVASVVAVCFVFNTTWLKILIAPKLWLIEYAAKLAG